MLSKEVYIYPSPYARMQAPLSYIKVTVCPIQFVYRAWAYCLWCLLHVPEVSMLSVDAYR